MTDYIQEYYKLDLYTDSDLNIFVSAGMISLDEETTIKASKAST
ncbi:hypothetical protein IMAU10228_00832 [Lactiplantibacillus plantarum]|nr:hypothetical protein [Lactiplantibacillus plantarum]